MAGSTFDFCQGLAATLANCWVAWILAYVDGIVPAAVALFSGRSVHNNNQISCSSYFCDGSRRFDNVI